MSHIKSIVVARLASSFLSTVFLIAASPRALAINEHEVSREPSTTTKKITILMLNDVYQDEPVDKGERGGFARVSTLRKEILSRQPNTLFLFAGDTLSPSVASRTFRGKQMIAAWNAVGIDYATLGNHEFDFGPNVLTDRIADSKFKWLCANVIDKTTGKSWAALDPYVIRDVGGIKVGILGLLTPDTLHSSRTGPNIDIADPCTVAQKLVPEMRSKGAQVIIALTHLDLYQDKQVANCVKLDLVVGGHEHVVLQSVAGGAPILKAGSDARNLGRIDIEYSEAEKKVKSIDWELIPVTDRIAADQSVVVVVNEYEGKLNAELDQPVGDTSVVLDATQASNQTKETNLGDLIGDAYREETGADVVIFNGGSIRSNQTYGPGKLTRRDVLSILPFENPIVKLQVNGSLIKEALEHGVAEVGKKSDGRFPQVSGLTFEYDTTKPAGQRVSNILIHGRPLNDSRMYSFATNTYVTSGGDGYAMFRDPHYLLKPEEGNSESVALLNTITRLKSISPKVEGRIRRLDPVI